MKLRPVLLPVLIFAALACWLQAPVHAAPGAGPDIVPDEVLVGMRAGHETSDSVNRVTRAVGGSVRGSHAKLHSYRLKIRQGLSVAAAVAQLQQNPDVLYAEPNVILHTQATPSDQYYLNQYGPQRTQTDLAWDAWQPKAQVVVAIVDTGIDYTHPDLVNKIYRDANGNVIGYNALGSNVHSGIGTDPSDDHGHGTHCAGIAGAEINNGIGVAGIAGWSSQTGGTSTVSTKLMPVKVLDSTGSGSTSAVAAGVTWAADHGAKVISLSLGGGGTSTLANAVQYAWNKGCIVVAAAGNSSSNALNYPAAYPNVISVAATDGTDTLASYSNYGSWVTVAAPGSGILSTLPTYAAGAGFGTNYGALSGTSMATPHVAGEAALLAAQDPTLTNAQIRSAILANVDPYTPYAGRAIGASAGRINVYRALQAIGGTPPPAVPAAPASLTATPGNGQISLSWAASTGATSYNVKRSTTSGGPYTTVASGVTSTSKLDTGLTNGTTCYYVVTAVNGSGESANSNQASATPVPPAPAAPTGLTATPGTTQVSLSWNASTGATAYEVERQDPGANFVRIAATGATSYTDTGLQSGVTCNYRVRATNLGGVSAYSTVVSATTSGTSFSVSGKVTAGGVGLGGVLVAGGAATTFSAADGTYTLTGFTAGSYGIIASAPGYTFATQIVTLGPSQTGVNFDAPANSSTFTISGRVTAGGTGLGGVLVAGGAATTFTAPDGTYTLTGFTAGRYGVIVSAPGYTFPVQAVTVGPSQTGVNFDAPGAPGTTYTISGKVTVGGVAKGGVLVAGGAATTYTAADGTYTLTGFTPGSYGIIASAPGYTFPVVAVTVGPSQTGVNIAGQ